jgi:hypothetical protein
MTLDVARASRKLMVEPFGDGRTESAHGRRRLDAARRKAHLANRGRERPTAKIAPWSAAKRAARWGLCAACAVSARGLR